MEDQEMSQLEMAGPSLAAAKNYGALRRARVALNIPPCLLVYPHHTHHSHLLPYELQAKMSEITDGR